MSPGPPHESHKKKLARIFEAYLDHLEIPAEGVGWTVKNKRKKLGDQADQCYAFTTVPVGPSARAPDLVLEVATPLSFRDKLEVWRQLGAKEVWLWWRSALEVYVRKGDDLAPARRSALVPAIDLDLVVRCMHEKTQNAAVQALRAALAKKRG